MFMQTCMYVGCNTFAQLPDILAKQQDVDETIAEATVCGAARVFYKYLDEWLRIEEYPSTRMIEWRSISDRVNDWYEFLLTLTSQTPLQEVLDKVADFAVKHPVEFMREQHWHEPQGVNTKVLMLNRECYYFRLPSYCVATTHNVIGSVAGYCRGEQQMIEAAFVEVKNRSLPNGERRYASEWGLSWVPVSELSLGASEAFKTEQSYLLADMGVFPPDSLAKWVWGEWVKLYGDTFEKDRAKRENGSSLPKMNLQ